MTSTLGAQAHAAHEAMSATAWQTNFNNPAVAVQSWYVVARSRELRRGQAKSYPLLNRRLALYRDFSGTVHALDARCAHLGADLGDGQVIGDRLQCAFHHWCFGPDGACCDAPGLAATPPRQVRAYPVQERWGLIWIFNGPEPLFDLPGVPTAERFVALRLPSQTINCHPHLVIANGLDVTHYETLHGMVFSAAPRLIVDQPYRITLEVRGRPRSRFLQYLTGSWRDDIVATFTTIGGHLAWATVLGPIRFHMLFTGLTSAEGGCQTQTVLFLPTRPWAFAQAVVLVYVLLRDDHRILDNLKFSPGFTENDAGLKSFAEIVNSMETW
jgi:nitrite reductase/ring-hydroxylating ferredoxin subunit